MKCNILLQLFTKKRLESYIYIYYIIVYKYVKY